MLNRRSTKLAVLLAALAVLPLAASANAIKLRAGNLLIYAEGGFSPTKLPRYENAPVTAHGSVKITTVDGSLPPILKTIGLEFDKNGAVDTTGLEVCKRHKLEARTVDEARRACPKAVVGRGFGHAIVAFPESKTINIDTPITVFNGPERHGNPTVLAHAYVTYPAPVALVIPVEIETINKGVYGYRTEVRIPKLAGGAGIPISGHLKVGKQWTYKGETHSYISGRCPTGQGQTRVRVGFNDDTSLVGVLLSTCQMRR